MILPYTLRLVCLCFASFFAVHTALATTIWAATPRAIRAGETMRARTGAQFLLALRLLPVAFAALAVAGLCVPSYLWLETNESTERVGLACCAMALLGVLVCAASLVRAVRRIVESWRGVRECKGAGFAKFTGDSLPVTILDSDVPVVALAGLVRPRVIVSRSVLNSLPPEELDTAIAHEHAHARARDNLKRMALALAPEILPFTGAFARLDRSWAKVIEWAADDDATQGNFGRSLSLAAALVHIARMGAAFSASPLISYLVGSDGELSTRIDRLITPAHVYGKFPQRLRMALRIGAAVAGVLAVAAIIHPSFLISVHDALEQLLR